MRWRAAKLGSYLKEKVYYSEGIAVVKREEGLVTILCAFCQGKGRGFSRIDKCPSCSGRGILQFREPIIPCAFCQGTGRAEAHTVTSCPTCRGRGVHEISEPFQTCPNCLGTGHRDRTRMTCPRCMGKGVVYG